MTALVSRLLAEVPNLAHGFETSEAPPASGLRRLKQIHSKICVVLDSPTPATEGDALATQSLAPIGVQTADCVPALFASRTGETIAAAHAGWRGIRSGVLSETVAALEKLGEKPNNLVVALGPSIYPCCFEVSEEVADSFKELASELGEPQSNWVLRSAADRPSAFRRENCAAPRGGGFWIDLQAFCVVELERAGIPREQIEIVGGCTYCGPRSFASFRRATHEGIKAGRQWSWIQKTLSPS